MKIKNQILTRINQKPIVYDTFYNDNKKQKPLVVFCHGYKGFKDWGTWDLVANNFAKQDLFFVKFNFSHNGGTVNQPIDFPDLDAFAENNYTKELQDLDDILNHFTSDQSIYKNNIDTNNITLIGHSRGGGISIIKASEDHRITKLITWASVCAFGKRTSTTGDLEQWKQDGVKYVLNSRTKQNMPHNFQFYLDYINNKDRLDIENCCKRLTIPHLIIHGTKDPSVSFEEAKSLKLWSTKNTLIALPETNHVFNAKHPWTENYLPETLEVVTKKSIAFIN
ncbi:alpha/beta hydrolase [Olleya sp. UBA1516]|uniref:alpha/beta hydrolase family protein n=1 Tax=Olleya sp. UBA1516 TaxID=1947013 RepID=UPI0025DDE255|nr:alpha/beta hydrolase [Olleya sp. UBA1516]|tara:strand:+ start:16683 stop:17522 length:840 start_codon:yes stop_codon:yes gene_type:complete